MKFFLLFFSTYLFAADPTPKYLPDFKGTMFVDLQKNIPTEFTAGTLENCKHTSSTSSIYDDHICNLKDTKLTWKDIDGRTLTASFKVVIILHHKKTKQYHFSFTGAIEPTYPEYKDLPKFFLKLSNEVDTPKLLLGNISGFGLNGPIRAEISGLTN